MNPGTRWLLLGTAVIAIAIAIAAGAVDRSGILRPPPAPIVETPELLEAGKIVYRNKCHHCHNDIPLAKRVKDWTPERAYETIGRLPQVYRSMPPFFGTDEERRALAVWIAAVGGGRMPQH